jgi:C4-dicarboxylate-specific signal transduction histidine kinase
VLWDEFPAVPNEEAVRRVVYERVPVTDEFYYAQLGEWVENHMYPGHDGGLVTFQRYITQRKRTEEDLRTTQAELAHVTRLTTLGELAASIAHEVNQPLGAIVNNGNACLRILSKENCPAEVSACLNDMVKDAIRASSIIVRIRSLTKRSTPERAPLLLKDVVCEVLTLAHHELSVTINTDFDDEPSTVLVDRVLLQQVLINLLINGVEAMRDVEEQDRILMIRERRVMSESPPVVLLSINDRGRGFKPENLDRLFDAFYTTKSQGMGMGLRISRSIIEAHGGRLWLNPNSGPGMTAQFTLPLADITAASA